MANKEEYIKELESNMDKYKNKISKIDSLLKNYKSDDKNNLVTESDNLKLKLQQAEQSLKKLKSATADTYETLKESSEEMWGSIKEAFHEFSSLLSMEQLIRTKDEIADYGSERIEDVQEYIKKRPLMTAAWALGIGFLVGTLLTRSK